MPGLDLEIRGGRSPKKFFLALRASFWSKNKGGRPRVPPMDPPLYHDIRFTVVGIDPGLVVHGVGQVSMQIHGTSKARRG